jgi:cell division septation protein DedD
MPRPAEPVVVLTPSPPEDAPVVVLRPAPVPSATPAPAAAGGAQPAGADTIAALIAAQTGAPAGTEGGAQVGAETATQTSDAAAAPAEGETQQTAVAAPAVTPAASPAVVLPAPSPASTPVIPAGAFLIQLASLTSVEAAEKTWVSLQRQHGVLLGDMAVNIQKAEIDGKGTYFRVQAGPLPNRATADDMCAQLKAAQQDCIVVKR